MNIVALHINQTPRDYKDIVKAYAGEFHGETTAGTDFFVKVRLPDKVTTNEFAMRENRTRPLTTEQALMAERIRQAAEARGRASGLGAAGGHGVVDSGASIEVLIMHGQQRFTSKVRVNTDNTYVDSATNRSHKDLRSAIRHTMEVFEARKGVSAAPAYARTQVEAPTIAQMRR